MTLTPGVTVVVPHYGDPAHATSLVRQLADQQAAVPVQVVVVDDCSPQPYPDAGTLAEVVRRERTGGFGSAVNSGVEHAEHDLLLVLNSDLTLPPGILDELVAAAAPLMPALVAPTVVCDGRVTGGQRFPRASFQVVEWVSLLGRWRDTGWFRRAIGKVDPALPGGVRAVDWVAGEAMLVPTAAFRAVGGFDETFYMYAEEVDLQRRLRDGGVPAYLVDTTPVRHAGAASSDPLRSRGWLTTSRLHYAEKWGFARRLRAGLYLATTLNLLVNAVRRLGGRDVRPLTTARAEIDLIRGQARAR